MTDYDMSLYNKDFFDEVQSQKMAYLRLAECIDDVVSPLVTDKTLVDVGCGTGWVLRHLHENHGWRGIGLDIEAARPYAKENIDYFYAVDLCSTVDTTSFEGELVICTEVAEHLPTSAAPHLLDTIHSLLPKVIVWSAACPGQGGTGHINCQPPEYWLEKFAAYGRKSNVEASERLRHLMRQKLALHHGYCQNFWVLV